MEYETLRAFLAERFVITGEPEAERWAALSPLTQDKVRVLAEFEQWLNSKRYSQNTVKTYLEALRTFLRFHSGIPIGEIDNRAVIGFNNRYILKRGYSSSYQNQVVNAIKLFFRTIENRSLDPELVHRPKREKRLPNVLSKEEVRALLEAPVNLKHRTMLSLIYACGLRRGELLALTLQSVDAKRGLLIVKKSKGRKDRVVPLGEKILEKLRAYYRVYKPQTFLFEGLTPGTAYSEKKPGKRIKTSGCKMRNTKARISEKINPPEKRNLWRLAY